MSFVKTSLLTLIAFLLVTSLLAQSSAPNTLVYQSTYIRVKPGQAAAFEALERTRWKPVYQELVRQGKLVSWLLLKRVSTQKTKPAHEYITMMAFRRVEDTARLFEGQEANLAKLAGVESWQELRQQTAAVGQEVRTTATKSFRISAGNGTGTAANWRFLRMNRIAVARGKREAYQSFVNTELGLTFDALRADSLLMSYNFTEELLTESKAVPAVVAAQSFPTLERAQRFDPTRDITTKLGPDAARRLLTTQDKLSSLKEVAIYEKIDNTVRRGQ